MKRFFSIKIIVLLIIICGGTYLLTRSLCIAAGVGILMYVLDSIVGAWADHMDDKYFYNKDKNGETH